MFRSTGDYKWALGVSESKQLFTVTERRVEGVKVVELKKQSTKFDQNIHLFRPNRKTTQCR